MILVYDIYSQRQSQNQIVNRPVPVRDDIDTIPAVIISFATSTTATTTTRYTFSKIDTFPNDPRVRFTPARIPGFRLL